MERFSNCYLLDMIVPNTVDRIKHFVLIGGIGLLGVAICSIVLFIMMKKGKKKNK